ncbi:hypothetical protein ZIOFF_012093 [Zingiber officinale]|uniref:Altered inheritance of mitochondria protein 24, mitochondrial n=1 Tax=Zingiber officinale TaxID=94328 RepID=A0A8J5LTP1_ZINOF|nr:hypothetical protein ZIOFF_012093 [Zingiber officinale]
MAAPFFATPFQPYVYQVRLSSSVSRPSGFYYVLNFVRDSVMGLAADPKVHTLVTLVFLVVYDYNVEIPRKAYCKACNSGTICYMSGSIQMENNYIPENEAGLWHWFFGKNVTSIVLSNPSQEDGFVGIAAPSPARILPIDLSNFDGELLCQTDAFLCSVNDVRLSSNVDQRPHNIEVGAEVILKQKLVGQGLVFLVGCGSVVQKILAPGEAFIVDVSSIIAMSTTITFQLKPSITMRRVVFGGDNQLMTTLTGPGVVFIQSMPFPRLSQRIARAVASPSLRDNPKFFMQIALIFFLAYVMIVSSLILTDV